MDIRGIAQSDDKEYDAVGPDPLSAVSAFAVELEKKAERIRTRQQLIRKNNMAHNETHQPKGFTMPTVEENIVVPVEYFELRINKKIVKRVVVATAAAAALVGVVLVKKNLNVETTEDSITIEKSDTVNGI